MVRNTRKEVGQSMKKDILGPLKSEIIRIYPEIASDYEKFKITVDFLVRYPEVGSIILKQTKKKGKTINCPFTFDCKAFPCNTLHCNADNCLNGHPHRMS